MESNNSKRKKVIVVVCAVIAVVLLVLCGLVIGLIKYREKQHQEELQQLQEEARVEVPDPVEETPEKEVVPIDFDTIRESNPDIVAWITVPGTDVDYPVLQSSEDMEEDFYLTHNLDGSGGYPGCIYIQKVNRPDFSDYVSILYGHNMKDGSMFTSLHNYEDAEFFDQNREFIIYTPEEVKHYEIVAATNYDDRLIPAFYNNFASTNDTKNFLDGLYLHEGVDNNHFADYQSLDFEGDYAVLSTCTIESDERYLVVGLIKN